MKTLQFINRKPKFPLTENEEFLLQQLFIKTKNPFDLLPISEIIQRVLSTKGLSERDQLLIEAIILEEASKIFKSTKPFSLAKYRKQLERDRKPIKINNDHQEQKELPESTT